ncbi:hypothetical protein I4U23_013326 [Adineta vaga]|nr:hypothetical protein I4U23_013326 [Adineta vaga]
MIDSRLKLHHMTILGTHNSYHKATRFYKYKHSNLDVQLMSGIRQIELDIHIMAKNYVVYHLQFLDDQTNCYCFKDCLLKIRQWSEQNQNHYPIFLFIEIKERFYEDFLTAFHGGLQCQHFQSMKEQILQIFPYDFLILPDFIRGHHHSINIALKHQRQDESRGNYVYKNYGWPPVSLSLGKILISFIDDQYNLVADLISTCQPLYNFFFIVQENVSRPYASIINIRNPLGNEQLILSSQNHGQITRTLIGHGNKQAFYRYIQARRYGVHIISTDFVQCNHSCLCESIRNDFQNSSSNLCNQIVAPSFCYLTNSFL